MDGWTDGRMDVVLGSKAQHQVLVIWGRSISTGSGPVSRLHSLGSLLEGQQGMIFPSSYVERLSDRTHISVHTCARTHTHTHTHFDPGRSSLHPPLQNSEIKSVCLPSLPLPTNLFTCPLVRPHFSLLAAGPSHREETLCRGGSEGLEVAQISTPGPHLSTGQGT